MEKRERAYGILQKHRLLEHLAEIGTPTVIGSLQMDLMVSNDIDIDVDNSKMSLEQLYGLTGYILKAFHPTWYEAKEEVGSDGKTVWFQGFEAILEGELWNFDIWFFDPDTIRTADAYCRQVALKANRDPRARDAILDIKRRLIGLGLYGTAPYTSTAVYHAVLEENIRDIQQFLDRYRK